MTDRFLAPSEVRIGGKYRFELIPARHQLHTRRIEAAEHFVEVIGFSTWPNGQRAILVQEWRDGHKLTDGFGIPAISDKSDHWRVTEIEPP